MSDLSRNDIQPDELLTARDVPRLPHGLATVFVVRCQDETEMLATLDDDGLLRALDQSGFGFRRGRWCIVGVFDGEGSA